MDRRTFATRLAFAGAAPLMVGKAATAKVAAHVVAAPLLASGAQTHHRTVDIDGLPIFYREAGPTNAPVVLLLHGWPSSSRMFRNLIPQLADRYHVYAPDYPGFGNSAAPSAIDFSYSFDQFGEIIEKFVQKMGIKRFALYNMDFGGPVGYRLMLREPHRVSALIVQNGPAYPEGGSGGWWGTLSQYWKDGSAESREKVRKEYLSVASFRDQYVVGVRDPSTIDPENWLVDHGLATRPGMEDVSLDMLYDIRRNVPVFAAARAYFRAVQPPTLIVSGRNDKIFPGENQQQYLGDLPHAEIHLTDSGHCALEDRGIEIAARMHDFLGRKLTTS
jgi:pimeloyl-ACP methyl ester carboxylesterase